MYMENNIILEKLKYIEKKLECMDSTQQKQYNELKEMMNSKTDVNLFNLTTCKQQTEITKVEKSMEDIQREQIKLTLSQANSTTKLSMIIGVFLLFASYIIDLIWKNIANK